MRFLPLLILLAACSAKPAPPDAAGAVEVAAEWDGKCLGRPGDAGRNVLWGYHAYQCRNHGKKGWWFEQDPNAGRGTHFDGIVIDWEVKVP